MNSTYLWGSFHYKTWWRLHCNMTEPYNNNNNNIHCKVLPFLDNNVLTRWNFFGFPVFYWYYSYGVLISANKIFTVLCSPDTSAFGPDVCVSRWLQAITSVLTERKKLTMLYNTPVKYLPQGAAFVWSVFVLNWQRLKCSLPVWKISLISVDREVSVFLLWEGTGISGDLSDLSADGTGQLWWEAGALSTRSVGLLCVEVLPICVWA